jgi:hypothetical protein
MAERGYPEFFEVLIGQVTQDREIDIVLGKALGVLGHAELFEPVRTSRLLPTRISSRASG